MTQTFTYHNDVRISRIHAMRVSMRREIAQLVADAALTISNRQEGYKGAVETLRREWA